MRLAAVSLLLPFATGSGLAALGAKSRAADVVSLYRKLGMPPYITRGGTAIVTGGNSGIGLESVKQLLSAGCGRVVLCARSVEAGEAALASLKDVDTSKARVQRLDLADLESIRDACAEIAEKDGTISLLLNNAGVMATPARLTKQGFELQLGTNHIGHHAFTRLLLPHMEPDGRVVTVASTAHTMGNVDVDDLMFTGGRKYSPWGAYGQSKGANILFAKGLADQLIAAGSSIKSVSLHPGVIRTELWRHGRTNLLGKISTWLLHKLIINKDIEQGASTSLYAALAPADTISHGAYLDNCAESEPNTQCSDVDGRLRRALWDETERLIAASGVQLPSSLLGDKARAADMTCEPSVSASPEAF